MTKKNYYREMMDRIKDDPVALAEYKDRANAASRRWRQRIKQDPDKYERYKQYLKDRKQKKLDSIKQDPVAWAEYKDRMKAMSWRWYQKIRQDPERHERYKRYMMARYQERKQRFRDQGLNSRGEPWYQPKPKAPRVPKTSLWEQLTGKTLQAWAEQRGVTREAVRGKFHKIRQRLDDPDHIFAEMKRTGEWPDLKFTRKNAVK